MTHDVVSHDVHVPQFPPQLESPMDPAPLFAHLRGSCPVARVRLPSADEAWLVTGYRDNRAMFADPRFSRAAAAAPGAPRLRAVALERDSLTTLDPPQHTRLRTAVLAWFSPAAARRLRPRIERAAEDLLAPMAAAGPPGDLVRGYAQPLALRVICDLLGIPAGDRDRFCADSDDHLGLDAAEPGRVAAAEARLREYLARMVAARRRAPDGEDVLCGLLRPGPGVRLRDEEVVGLAVTLLVAGYQTAANEIAASLVALFRHPDQLRALAGGHVRLEPAVEELLRYTPIAASGGTIRVARSDVELGGVLIRAGEGVLPSTTSANRDPAVFDRADELVLDREPNPHLAFGHGVHRCLGAHLARVEVAAAIEVLLRRFPRLRPAVALSDLDWECRKMIRGPRALPVDWS